MTRKVLRTERGTWARGLTCDHCEVVRINGVPTHETGCPVAWMDYAVECKWCGSEFFPKERHQKFCDSGCYASFYGIEEVGDDNAS